MKRIPTFRSADEEADFWAENSPEDFAAEFVPARANTRRPRMADHMTWGDWLLLLHGSLANGISGERLGGWPFAFDQFWTCLTSPFWPEED